MRAMRVGCWAGLLRAGFSARARKTARGARALPGHEKADRQVRSTVRFVEVGSGEIRAGNWEPGYFIRSGSTASLLPPME